ncbi:MAG: hypothetical protein L6Q37_08980 [Bdellovibrionaceae bacterium]|nr:hypothetical protein [Bacteriovoracaceae bacterium]MCK6598481.1 hypothetical protein [Pseudobdellovibrionaceae bacterium]NUM57621.1 hypothetical protein [Pseudobdellovibrionaceae bacterium]
MKYFKLNFIAKIALVLMQVPVFSFAVKTLDSSDLSQVIQSLSFQQETEGQKLLMPLLRKALREKAFPHIWEEYQKNSNLSFGILSAKELFEKLDKFQLFQSTPNNSYQLDKERMDDFYLTNTCVGVMNNETLVHDSSALVALVLHIFLGACGWQDENYQLSLALLSYEESLASSSESPIHQIDHKRLFPANFNELIRNHNKTTKELLFSGGFTSVGGGGDVNSLKTKLLMYSYLFSLNEVPLTPTCRKRWENPTRLVMDIQDVEIESRAEYSKVELAKDHSSNVKIIIPKFSTRVSKIADLVAILALATLCQGIEEK